MKLTAEDNTVLCTYIISLFLSIYSEVEGLQVSTQGPLVQGGAGAGGKVWGSRVSRRAVSAPEGKQNGDIVVVGEPPWMSPAVQALSSKMRGRGGGIGGGGRGGTNTSRRLTTGNRNSTRAASLATHADGEDDVLPMVVEGPKGTVIRAVGGSEDHQVAGAALAQIQLDRRIAGKDMAAAGPPPPTPSIAHLGGTGSSRSRRGISVSGGGGVGGGGGSVGAGSMVLARASTSASASRAPAHDYTFGAVYQYHDSTGKAKLIGSTAELPERAFRRDMLHNTEVAKLMSGSGGDSSQLRLRSGGGSSVSMRASRSAGGGNQILSKVNGGNSSNISLLGGGPQVVWAGVGAVKMHTGPPTCTHVLSRTHVAIPPPPHHAISSRDGNPPIFC